MCIFPGQDNSMQPLSEYLMPGYKRKTFTYVIGVIHVLVFFCELVYGGISKRSIHGVFAKGNHMAGPPVDILETCGGKITCHIGNNGSICTGQVWRLVTAVMLHAGIIHIVSNLFFLFQIGFQLEKRWTTIRFAILYFITGIGASLLSAVASPFSVSVGASGALFGILGANLSDLLMNWQKYPQEQAKIEMCNVISSILINFLMSSGDKTIDTYAHFGGLLVGIASATFICPVLDGEQWTFAMKCFGAVSTFGYFVMMSCLLFVPGTICSKCAHHG